jgi:hypothetical protein
MKSNFMYRSETDMLRILEEGDGRMRTYLVRAVTWISALLVAFACMASFAMA